jgi:tetratricopeptide (TPR) repeat protein
MLLAGAAGFWAASLVVRSWDGKGPAKTVRDHLALPDTAGEAGPVVSFPQEASPASAGISAPPTDPELLARLPDPASPLPASQAAMAEEARKMAEHLVECFPSHPDSVEVQARCEKWLGNTAEAVAHWDRCLELDPRYGYALLGKATVSAEKGDYDQAADLFRKALDARPGWAEAELELARALVNDGLARESIAVLEEHVKRKPFLSEAYVLLGQACLEINDLPRAKAAYEAAVEILPDYTAAYYGLATVCARLGHREQTRRAMEQFQKHRAAEFEARKTDKIEYRDLDAMRADAAPLYLAAGQVYLARKRSAEAERLWRRAAALDARYPECRQALAWLYRSTGRLPQAIEMLEQLAAIEPDNRIYLEEIARLYAEAQQPDKAEEVRRRLAQSKG